MTPEPDHIKHLREMAEHLAPPKRYQFISDGGHGWLRVPRSEVDPLLARRISRYTYADATYLYLEEDCDAPLVMGALNITGDQFDYVHHDSESPIRQLPRL